MLDVEDHIDSLVRHIRLVQDACLLLGKRLIHKGRLDFGRLLIAKGFEHDVSKFYGIEWDFLHAGKDVPADKLELAISQHQAINSHHPEFHGGFGNMPELAVAEMVCDVYARSQEFGTSLRDWVDEKMIPRYNINKKSQQFKWFKAFVDLLLDNDFLQETEP